MSKRFRLPFSYSVDEVIGRIFERLKKDSRSTLAVSASMLEKMDEPQKEADIERAVEQLDTIRKNLLSVDTEIEECIVALIAFKEDIYEEKNDVGLSNSQ